MKKHLNILVTGKVQGVYFRRDTQLIARKLGIKGTVINQEDGCVYIQAEAEELNLSKFVEWCQHGPEMANVTMVDTVEGEIKGFNSFEVLAEPSDFLS
jgi:acylphosphatase